MFCIKNRFQADFFVICPNGESTRPWLTATIKNRNRKLVGVISTISGNDDIEITELQQPDKSVDKLSKLVAANNQLLKQYATRSNPLKRFAKSIIFQIGWWRNGKP